MVQKFEQDPTADELWRIYLQEGYPNEERERHIFRLLPTGPRCKKCYAPFKGIGGTLNQKMCS